MLLPKPKNNLNISSSKWSLLDDSNSDNESTNRGSGTTRKAKASIDKNPINSLIPTYGNRGKFVPLKQSDFQGGGAYPEIFLNQYPLDMGKVGEMKSHSGSNKSILALETDAKTGKIKYDVVLHGGNHNHERKKIIHSSLNDMRQQDTNKDFEFKPDQEEIQSITESTRLALEGMVDKKVKSNKPRALTEKPSDPTFVKYVPSEGASSSNKAVASSRIIRISEAPIDPLEPSRFKHRKIPRTTGSPPPPVLRSPPRKVSAEEQKNWIIPPCISNWKNAKGYTIPLDKRLANDGRGMQDVTINDNFSKLSEALFIADRHAREEVKLRSELSTRVLRKEKVDQEEKLRRLAEKARGERSTMATKSGPIQSSSSEDDSSSNDDDEERMTAEEKRQLRERQDLRKEKARQREKLLRKGGAKEKGERDISEKIALGISQPSLAADSMYDQRLFNQTSGISSGYGGPTDAYSVYDKPLFNSTVSNIYKPTVGHSDGAVDIEGVDVGQFENMIGSTARVHKGFAGTEAVGNQAPSQTGPVLFEKEKDVFGVDAFISAAKRGHQDDDKATSKKTKR